MPEGSSNKAPASLGAAIGAVVIGLFAARGYNGAKPSSDDAPKLASAASSEASGSGPADHEDDATPPDALTLRPLGEVIFGEKSPSLKKEPACAWRCDAEAIGGPPAVRCLIATVPDPVNASISFRFDETLDAIERSAVTRRYVLERWRFPWAEKGKAGDARSTLRLGTLRLGTLRLDHAAASRPANPPRSVPGEPGLMVFRRVSKGGEGEEELLAVFLVPETPTFGVDRSALARSLTLAEVVESDFPDRGRKPAAPRWFARGKGEFEVNASPYGIFRRSGAVLGEFWEANETGELGAVRLLGPWFSGSMPTLRDGLLRWLKARGGPRRRCFVDVLSGSATAFDKEGFETALENAGHFARFRSAVHRSSTVIEAVLANLGESASGADVAILSELNTGAGEEASEAQTKVNLKLHNLKGVSLRYPLHIAEVRRQYESQGLFRDAASDAIRASGELRDKAEAASPVRDVVPDQTSGPSALSEDRVITQTLRYLEDNRFRVIGIVATDPRDAVFLARLIRRYCPDARVFAVITDLLYLDPASITDLRGMLIGSTYPLYPLNHDWTGSAPSSRGQVFPSQHAQGGYNAMTILLNRMIDGDERRGLLEYAAPPLLRQRPEDRTDRPPVWISVVGERSLFPVDCRTQVDGEVPDEGYLCTPTRWHWQVEDAAEPDATRLKVTRVTGWAVLVGIAASAILAYQSLRLRALTDLARGEAREHRHPFPMPADSPVASALTICIAIAYLYVAWPAWRGDISLFPSPGFPSSIARPLLLAAIVAAAAISVFVPMAVSRVFAPIEIPRLEPKFLGSEERAGRVRRAAKIEYLGLIACASLAVGWAIASFESTIGRASGVLWAVRSIPLTGGVSTFVPVGFVALAAVLYAGMRSRIDRITRLDGLVGAPRAPRRRARYYESLGGPGEAMRQIATHRAALNEVFPAVGAVAPTADVRGPGPAGGAEGASRLPGAGPTGTFVRRLGAVFHGRRARWMDLGRATALVFTIGVAIDAIVLRPIAWSGEGKAFDVAYRLAFGAMLVMTAFQAARLSRAWRELRAVLDGFAQVLGRGFDRMPSRITSWLFHPEAGRSEYGVLIRRQVGAIRSIRGTSSLGPRDLRAGKEFRIYLNVIEFFNKRPTDPAFDEQIKDPEVLHRMISEEFPEPRIPHRLPLGEVDALRFFARKLVPIWSRRPVSAEPDGAKGARAEERKYEEAMTAALEDLLALEATRWIGGAMARIWTLIGFLVAGPILLLFAMTSYPFPEQPRVITSIGLGIVAILVLVLRVVLGSSRDQVISRIGNTTPGKVSWDGSTFGSLGTYVVPLVGVLAAISFNATDLFRSVLGPILRMFP